MSSPNQDHRELDKTFVRVQELDHVDTGALLVSLGMVLDAIELRGAGIAGWTERFVKRQGFASLAELARKRIQNVGDLRILQIYAPEFPFDKLCAGLNPETPVLLV
jgi:hypothetical protein